MKIAVVRQKYVNYGGAEKFVYEYTTHLANAGHNVHIFANQWTQSSHPNIRVHPVRAIKINSFLRTLSFASFALWAVRSKSFDVVQSHERIWSQDVYRAGDGCHRPAEEPQRSVADPFGNRCIRIRGQKRDRGLRLRWLCRKTAGELQTLVEDTIAKAGS